jgi:hypothetical protein
MGCWRPFIVAAVLFACQGRLHLYLSMLRSSSRTWKTELLEYFQQIYKADCNIPGAQLRESFLFSEIEVSIRVIRTKFTKTFPAGTSIDAEASAVCSGMLWAGVTAMAGCRMPQRLIPHIGPIINWIS